jgi:hypothetical protein
MAFFGYGDAKAKTENCSELKRVASAIASHKNDLIMLPVTKHGMERHDEL